MDDWIHSAYIDTYFKAYWKRKLENNFQKLLNVTDLNIGISEKMAMEYSLKYNKKFYYFHNPINIKKWQKCDFINPKLNNDFCFVFTGKINKDTYQPIKEFVQALENCKNKNISFKIYSTTPCDVINHFLGNSIDKYFKGSVEYEKVPGILKSANGLLLPLSFEKKSIKYTRLSIPTKVTEYMASGSPVLLYAPQNIAISEYLLKHKSAYVVNSRKSLSSSIIDFTENKELINEIAKNAYDLVISRHETSIVQEDLRKLLLSIALNNK